MTNEIELPKLENSIKNCQIKYKVGYDALWYISRVYALFIIVGASNIFFGIARLIIATVGVVAVIADMTLGILSSRKWKSGKISIHRKKRGIALYLWDRGLTEVFWQKYAYISSINENKLIIKIEDKRLLRRKIYKLKFESNDCFSIVKNIFLPN
ncbi:MAG: hypothetical protein ACP6IS_08080 [Candidatus Asgardarchaeia archaeon]